MERRNLTYCQAIHEATDQMLQNDPNVFVIGLGINDPKSVFGSTLGLEQKYGASRVMEMPASENAMTGIVIGAAAMGLRPLMIHQRVDFFLLGMDQLVNNAVKWSYMFGNNMNVPIVIRLVIGKGWGQGAQHSQTLHGMFAHFPGLNVVMPSTPYDAKGLLVSALKSNTPTIYIDHRWLYNVHGEVPLNLYEVEIGKSNIIKQGGEITVVGVSEAVFEAYKAVKLLQEHNVDPEIIDLRSVSPLDHETIINSVKKTRRLLVLDPDWKMCGISSEIIALVSENVPNLKELPKRLTFPDTPCPTSWALSNHFYFNHFDIAHNILKMMNMEKEAATILQENLYRKNSVPLDVPDPSFVGPF